MKRCLILLYLVCAITLISCSESPQPKQALETVSGKHLQFPNSEGKWIIVNLWASWCMPCRDEMVVLKELEKQGTIQVVAYNIDNLSKPELEHLAKHFNLSYPLLTENPVPLLNLPAYPGIPATYIMTPDGDWLKPLFGLQTKQTILKAIEEKRLA